MGSKPQPASGSQEAIGIPITVLKADPKNPRKIDEEAKAGLAVSLETFGPLDITFNERTGELVSGHQRIAALKAAGAIKVERKAGENFGWIEHPKTGEKFPVRFVDWDETKQRMGNLVANNPHLQGQFDEQAVDQLRSIQEEIGFAELGLSKLIADQEARNIEVQELELGSFKEKLEGSSGFFSLTLTIENDLKDLFSGMDKAKAIVVLANWLRGENV